MTKGPYFEFVVLNVMLKAFQLVGFELMLHCFGGLQPLRAEWLELHTT